MNDNPEARARSSVRAVLAAQARAAAGSTAVAAMLLLYFGYSSTEPARNDLGDWSLWILFYTLRLGGLACAGLTIILFLGVGAALIADAIISTLIGVSLILTGAGLAIGGGTMMQAAINVVGGFMFASYGIRTGLQFVAIRAGSPNTVTRPDLTPSHSKEVVFERPAPLPLSAPHQKDADAISIDALRTQKSARRTPATPAATAPTSSEVKSTDSPSEEGYLAALAKNRSPKDDAPGAA